MIAHAEGQTPETVRREYEVAYREMRAAGYTAVGEFHYLGFDEALAASAAAEAAGIGFVLLYAAYGRGGTDRFRQASVGSTPPVDDCARVDDGRCCPQSVRTCPRTARGDRSLAEQEEPSPRPRRRAAARDRRVPRRARESGPSSSSPEQDLGARTTMVHAPTRTDEELDWWPTAAHGLRCRRPSEPRRTAFSASKRSRARLGLCTARLELPRPIRSRSCGSRRNRPPGSRARCHPASPSWLRVREGAASIGIEAGRVSSTSRINSRRHLGRRLSGTRHEMLGRRAVLGVLRTGANQGVLSIDGPMETVLPCCDLAAVATPVFVIPPPPWNA